MTVTATSGQGSALLSANRLSCRRGDRVLFAGLDIVLHPGALLLVEGPNGVGKSSLLGICAGLLRPAGGAVTANATVGLCDERLPLDGDKTLDRALDYWRSSYGCDRASLDAVTDLLALTRLLPVPVAYLSTGQRQRARMARLMLSEARLWLLDEPANGLDAEARAQLGTVIERHLASGGAVIATSHIGLPHEPTARLALADYAP